MQIALLPMSMIVAAFLVALVSPYIARRLGIALLSHADALDAYRACYLKRAGHWSKAVSRGRKPVTEDRRDQAPAEAEASV